MQVTERVHALKIPFEIRVGPETTVERFVYIYLIFGEEIHLIDTGVASSQYKIFDYIREWGREPQEISTVIQTHSHPDHIGATRSIKEATGCIVAIHEAEKAWVEDVELQFKERPVPGFHSFVGGSVEVDHTLQDGGVVQLEDGLSLEVFHTPGHSKGSVSLLLREDSAVFCGDAVPLKGDIPIYEDLQATISSINELKSLDIDFLLSSWDEPRKGEEAYKVVEESLQYLETIHRTVLQLSSDRSIDLQELTSKVLEELGFPPKAANPLVVRSFQSNLENRSMNLLKSG